MMGHLKGASNWLQFFSLPHRLPLFLFKTPSTMQWKSLYTLASLLAAVSAADITGCHYHGATQFCIDEDGNEGYVTPAPSQTADAPSSYTGCHLHGSETFCLNGQNEAQFVVETAQATSGSASASITSATASSSSVAAQTTAVTGCHNHGSNLFCIDGNGNEGQITPAPSGTAAPESFTGCHNHGTETFCLDEAGLEVQFVNEEDVGSHDPADVDNPEMDCHYHAGVPHCIPKGGSDTFGAQAQSCDRNEAEYKIPLRIGLLFAILATDCIGVFLPFFVHRFFNSHMDGVIVTLFKQFGTGVILSTALVHLMTHAMLMWNNSCITLKYESTATSITMAGLFIGFLIEYLMSRILNSRVEKLKSAAGAQVSSEEEGRSSEDEKVARENNGHEHTSHDHHDLDIAAKQDKTAVSLLEAGIVFHSVLIGITLVVTPDKDGAFITLFIVIIFHQAFEGVALGTRIAELQKVNIWIKILMGLIFAITTPLGMAIGTGVLQKFNGNDPSTIIALGTLDSFSAGILLWVGLIEMLSHDWLHGSLVRASWLKVAIGLFGLVAGMILMSFIGKWA